VDRSDFTFYRINHALKFKLISILIYTRCTVNTILNAIMLYTGR
jgi:hypothetical protein